MIPKSSKLPLRTEFLEFRRRASRVTTPLSTIFFLQTTSSSRLAVIIPKKLSNLATTRNWLKRLTYDTLWPLLQPRSLDCVVLYKPIKTLKSTKTKLQIITELKSFIQTL